MLLPTFCLFSLEVSGDRAIGSTRLEQPVALCARGAFGAAGIEKRLEPVAIGYLHLAAALLLTVARNHSSAA